MIVPRGLLALAAASGFLLWGCAPPAVGRTSLAAAQPIEVTRDCPQLADIGSICGPVGVEDLVQLPGSHWMLGGGLSFGAPAHFHAVDAESLRAFAIDWVSASQAGQSRAGCLGPPDKARLSINGLALTPAVDRTAILYAANHGDRNAVEVFALDWRDAEAAPRMQWQDCIVLPQGGEANAIGLLPGNGIAVSLFPSLQDQAAWARMERGEPAGEILLWRPGEEQRRLDAGPISGPNGLFASTAEALLYVSDWAGRQIVSVDLNTGERKVFALDLLPDNIHQQADGTLLVTGQRTTPAAIAACTGPVCMQDWAILRLDPATGTIATLLERRGEAAASYGASAVTWNNRLFVTVRGDNRILHTEWPH